MVERPVKASLMTLTGFNPLSFAVLMMVMMIDTLRFPRSVIFPKVILRNKTAFLMPCSAGLLVGDIIGYLRNTNSSSLNMNYVNTRFNKNNKMKGLGDFEIRGLEKFGIFSGKLTF